MTCCVQASGGAGAVSKHLVLLLFHPIRWQGHQPSQRKTGEDTVFFRTSRLLGGERAFGDRDPKTEAWPGMARHGPPGVPFVGEFPDQIRLRRISVWDQIPFGRISVVGSDSSGTVGMVGMVGTVGMVVIAGAQPVSNNSSNSLYSTSPNQRYS